MASGMHCIKERHKWFVKKAEYLNAMHYYYLCGDFDALLSILEQSRSKIINNEHKGLLIQYLEECPREIRAKHHLALLIYAVRLFTFGERELFKKTCMEVTTNICSDTSLDEKTRNQLLGEFELVLSFTKYNDINGMSEHHKKSLQADERGNICYGQGWYLDFWLTIDFIPVLP